MRAETTAVDSAGGRRATLRWWSLAAVLLSTFMTQLDNTVVNVALPSMQRDLHLQIAGVEWVISAYMLAYAGLLLLGGRLADLFGIRRLFVVGLAVFTVASLVAGFSDSFTMLLVARVVQGVGAALATPTTLLIILATFQEPGERNKAIGLWGAMIALSFAFGPIIGGTISTYLHWGWIFFINVPLGIVAIVICLVSVDQLAGMSHNRRLDVPGLLSSGLVLFGLTYALIEAQQFGWTSPAILGCLAAVVVGVVVFVLVETRMPEPMFDVSLFANRVFTSGTLALVFWGCGMMGVFCYTSLYLQNVLRFSPVVAGAVFVPLAVVMAVFATISGQLAAKFGLIRMVVGGFVLGAVGLMLLAVPGDNATVLALQPALVIIGFGAGIVTPLQTAVANALPAAKAGAASGVLNAFREMSALCGVTVLGAILTGVSAHEVRAGLSANAAYLSGYHVAVIGGGGIIVLGAVAALVALLQGRRVTQEADSARGDDSVDTTSGVEAIP